jgi:hypothetical protein
MFQGEVCNTPKPLVCEKNSPMEFSNGKRWESGSLFGLYFERSRFFGTFFCMMETPQSTAQQGLRYRAFGCKKGLNWFESCHPDHKKMMK